MWFGTAREEENEKLEFGKGLAEGVHVRILTLLAIKGPVGRRFNHKDVARWLSMRSCKRPSPRFWGLIDDAEACKVPSCRWAARRKGRCP